MKYDMKKLPSRFKKLIKLVSDDKVKSGLTSRAEDIMENRTDVGSYSAEDKAEAYHVQRDIQSGRSLDDIPEDDGSRDYE